MDDRSETLGSDDGLPCRECGYDLRGLHAFRCPECGTEIDLYGHFARRAWSAEERAIAADRRAIRLHRAKWLTLTLVIAAAIALAAAYRSGISLSR